MTSFKTTMTLTIEEVTDIEGAITRERQKWEQGVGLFQNDPAMQLQMAANADRCMRLLVKLRQVDWISE